MPDRNNLRLVVELEPGSDVPSGRVSGTDAGGPFYGWTALASIIDAALQADRVAGHEAQGAGA